MLVKLNSAGFRNSNYESKKIGCISSKQALSILHIILFNCSMYPVYAAAVLTCFSIHTYPTVQIMQIVIFLLQCNAVVVRESRPPPITRNMNSCWKPTSSPSSQVLHLNSQIFWTQMEKQVSWKQSFHAVYLPSFSEKMCTCSKLDKIILLWDHLALWCQFWWVMRAPLAC